MSQLAQVATEVSQAMQTSPVVRLRQSRLATLAAQVETVIRRQTAAMDREAEWQRVHSYIADVLKDTHVLYAKLARLEGDFAGEELTRLERISEAVLQLGNELSGFSKAFYEGKYSMAETDFAYGGEGGGGGAPAPAPAPEAPAPEGEEGGEEDIEALLGGQEEEGAEQGAGAEEQAQQAQQ